MKTKNKIDIAKLIILLNREKTILIEQNNQKDIIIKQLQERLSNYEGSKIEC